MYETFDSDPFPIKWIVIETDTKKAVALAKKAYEQAPQSADIADTYGYFLVRDGQHQQGLKILQQAAKDKPQDNDIQYHLALAYSKNNQNNKAKAILEKIVNSNTLYSEQKHAQQLLQEL